MITITQNNHIYEIKSKYDPYLISLIKNVPGRQWNTVRKLWTIPVDKLGWFLNQLKNTEYESNISIKSNEAINKNEHLDSTEHNTIPNTDISDMDLYVHDGNSLYPHQTDFLKYAKARCGRGFILADQMGCGKTLEVMNYALYCRKVYGIKHCLIICCVNSSKFSWLEDIKYHTNGAEIPYILGTRIKRGGGIRYNTSGQHKITDLQTGHMYGNENAPELPFFLITNIESLRTKTGRHYQLAEEIIRMINNKQLQMISIDEIHKNTSPKSIQGKLLLEIKKETGNQVIWIPMTGTPIVNKPTDLYLPLKLVDGHSVKNYWLWCNHFCILGGYGDHEIVGYKNIPDLKQMLQKNMIRRLKSDVLDLPPKIYYNEFVENTVVQQNLYSKVRKNIIKDKEEIISSMNPIVQMLKLRQVNGNPELVDKNIIIDDKYVSKNAKLIRLLELIADIVNRDEKVVIFSNWVESLKTIYRFVASKYKTCCFTGSMDESVREKHKQMFISNPDYKIMLGTIGALGTNHTLTVANNVIFYDDPWNPATKSQAEDRVHRIGTNKSVNIYTLITKDTIDEVVNNILKDKQDISDYIVDNGLNIKNNPELFDKLLGND